MARPKKPAGLKAFEGDRGRRMKNAPTVPFVSAEIGPPSWLIGAIALEEWNRVAASLKADGRLALVDQGALAIYCESLGTYARAVATLADEGHVAVGARGGLMMSPWEVVKHNAYARFIKIAMEFGFTAAARGKLGPCEPQEDDKAKRFFG